MPSIGMKRGEIKSELIPDGTYRMRVAKAGVFTVEDALAKKPTSKMQDDVVEFDCVILDEGEFFGRHVFDSLPITGPFANRLGGFLEAIEYPEDDDVETERLVETEFFCAVRTQAAKGEYEARNRMGKCISVNQFDASAQAELEQEA